MYSKFLSLSRMDEQVCMSRRKSWVQQERKSTYAIFIIRGVPHKYLLTWALLKSIFFSKCLFLCVTHKKPSDIPKSFRRKIFGASKQQKKSRNFDMTAFDSRLKTNGHMGAPPPKPPSLPKFVHSNCHFADFQVDFAPLKIGLQSWFLDSTFPQVSILLWSKSHLLISSISSLKWEKVRRVSGCVKSCNVKNCASGVVQSARASHTSGSSFKRRLLRQKGVRSSVGCA